MELALTAIFRNEAPYLKEWIEFHLLMGVECFYLFDHFSTDAPQKILAPYIEQKLVYLTAWPIEYSDVYEWTEVQCLAYERAIRWASGKAKWLVILDVDEFLFPTRGTLLEALKPFEAYGGVGVNWQLFGTSNLAKIPEGKLMIEVLNWKASFDQEENCHIKSIVRPERVKGCDNAHSMMYHPGFYQVNTAKVPFEGCLSPTVEIDLLRINHYTLRDEFYLSTQKIHRLQKWWPQSLIQDVSNVQKKWLQAKFAAMNQVEDVAIHRFIPFLRKKNL